MTDHRWWALDLLLVVFLAEAAGAVVALAAPTPLRVAMVLALALFLPGYALVAVFFPATNRHASELASIEDRHGGLLNPLPADYEVDGIERLVLSTAFSIAILPAVAAVTNLLLGRLAVEPVLLGVVGLTVLLAVVAFVRRLRLPPEARFGVSAPAVASALRPFRPRSPLYRDARRAGSFNRAAAVGLLLVVASVGFAVAAPPPSESFTEFYVVTEDATGAASSSYPQSFEAGERGTVPLGVANHEGQEIRYTVVVATRDATAGSGAPPAEVGRREITIADGETRRFTVDFEPDRTGSDLELLLLLYRGDPPPEPTTDSAYRALDLSIDVSAGAERGTE